MAYSEVVSAAMGYLSKRILNPAWVKEHDDVAYYFAAPLAFFETATCEEAAKALDIVEPYVERGGADSKNPAYAYAYPHYPWMWMCWAATRMQRHELAQHCYERLCTYVHPTTSAGLVSTPFEGERDAPVEADLLATAEVVKTSQLVGRLEVAQAAADTLVKALESNREHMRNGRFYLRWTAVSPECAGSHGFGREHLNLVQEQDPFHCILQGAPGQLSFMLACPAMVLLELSKAVADVAVGASERYRATALQFLDFLKACDGVHEGTMAHKYAIAAALAGDSETVRRILDVLFSLQHSTGCFGEDPESMEAVEQTAEIVVGLLIIQRELA
jgi:hypothetical protein